MSATPRTPRQPSRAPWPLARPTGRPAWDVGGISGWYGRGVDYGGAGPPEEGGAIVDEQNGGSFLADMTDIEFAKYQQLIWQAETPKKLKQAKL